MSTMPNPRWRQRPEGSTWGDFGPDDQLGRLNLITDTKRLQGVAEVKTGKAFCLSLPLDYPGGNGLNPNRYPPVLRPTARSGGINYNFLFSRLVEGATDVLSDDLAVLHLQYSTQWDSFAHAGSMFDANGDGVPEPVYYNGFAAGQAVLGPESVADVGVPATNPQASPDSMRGASTCGASKLGIEHMATTGVQGRGVLINLRKHFGDGRTLVGYEQLMGVMQADGVAVEPGDMVCLYTGFSDLVLGMNRQPDNDTLHQACAVLDGRDERLKQWVTDSQLAVLIADNYAVEAYPARQGHEVCCAALPLHEHCLFKLGVHLGELWYLRELADWLAANGRYRFLLTAPPLRLPGAVGSPATPVATV